MSGIGGFFSTSSEASDSRQTAGDSAHQTRGNRNLSTESGGVTAGGNLTTGTSVTLGNRSTYNPVTNITGLDPTQALEAIGNLQLGNSGGGQTAGLASSITGAVGAVTDQQKYTKWILYGVGGLLVVGAVFYLISKLKH